MLAFRYFSWLLVIAGILSFYVWQQTQAVRLGYQVDALRRECEKMEQLNRDSRLRVNCLLSMERLDRIARDRQLIAPEDKSTIYLAG